MAPLNKSLQHKYMIDIIIPALKMGVVYKGLDTNLAKKILPSIQKKIPDANYIELYDNDVIFYTDESKKMVILQVEKAYNNYSQKAKIYQKALKSLNGKPSRIIPKVSTKETEKLNEGLEHKKKKSNNK